MSRCPGIYCGRIRIDGNLSQECGVCPTGFRSSSSLPDSSTSLMSECLACSQSLQLYDWFYILFMAVLLLVFEWYIIDFALKRRTLPLEVLSIHVSALFEVVAASLLTIIFTSEKMFNFTIKHCGVYRLSDWYTLFFNPSPNFKNTLRCTQEAVYPLYSMIFLFFLLSLLLLLVIRPFVIWKVWQKNASKTIYLTMYVIPTLAIIHAIFSGLIYYSYPFITLIGSIVSIACHFAFRLDQEISHLFYHSFRDARSILIIVGHWSLHAFGIISLTEFKDPVNTGFLLMLVPFPAAFYILTSTFSDPTKIRND